MNTGRWDGSSWSAFGSGINGWVDTVEAWGGDLYAGGTFSSAGGWPSANIARWMGASSGIEGRDGRFAEQSPRDERAGRLELLPPNPYSAVTAMTLTATGMVRIALHDTSGRRVRTPWNGSCMNGVRPLS